MALKGFTFDQMEVTAANDAGFYQRILPTDGVLWGCGLSNTVNSITFQAGMLVCGGRFVGFDGATTYTLPSEYATSTGYVRLVLTLDLSKQNTSGFAQGDVSWEYSATTKFSPLQQDSGFNNPYVSNKKYQMQMCIYPITSGNIGNLKTGTAVAATPDLPLSGGTLTGDVVVPKMTATEIDVKGNANRNIKMIWGGSVAQIYLTDDSGTTNNVLAISASTGGIAKLVLNNPTIFEFKNDMSAKATFAGGIQEAYNRVYKIPGATVIDVGGQYPATFDGIPNNGTLFQLPTGFYPSDSFSTWCFAQLNSGEVIRATATISTAGACTVALQAKKMDGSNVTGIRYFRMHTIIPQWY